jgi:hypothetical protein
MGQIGYSSGFAFQSTFKNKNLEVFIPWPEGGIAHYWRNHKWNGPVLFGTGSYRSVAVFEGPYGSFGKKHGNFELLGLTTDGRLVHWWRENDRGLIWHLGGELPNSAQGFTGLTFGRNHNSEGGDENSIEEWHAIAAEAGQGCRIFLRYEDDQHRWTGGERLRQLLDSSTVLTLNSKPLLGHFDGLGWAHGTVGDTRTNFDEAYASQAVFVGTRSDGLLVAHEDEPQFAATGTGKVFMTNRFAWRWDRPQRIGGPARGRPCIIQSDRGHRDLGFWGTFTLRNPRHGHYEVVVPSRDGGFLHFWRDNNTGDSWNFAGRIGAELYDEVALFQDGGKLRVGDETGQLHVFAWRRGERWLHHFTQSHYEDRFEWKGPLTVGYKAPGPQEVWEVTCASYSTFRGYPAYVHAIGGVRDGRPWRRTKREAIKMIKSGAVEFRTVAPNGSSAAVRIGAIVMGNGISEHLTTSPDFRKDNNLLSLPLCK